MSTLILVVIFGLAFASFATQNVGTINIRIGPYDFFGVPVYLIAFGSMLVGLILAWIINTVESIGSAVTIHDRESKLSNVADRNNRLEDRIHELEVENAKLKTNNNYEIRQGDLQKEFKEYRPSLWDRIRHPNLAT